MQSLEDVYMQLIVTERLAKVNFTDKIILDTLSNQYDAYRLRNEKAGKINPDKIGLYSPTNEEVDVINKILIKLDDLDKSYTSIFKKFKTAPIQLRKRLAMADGSWQHYLALNNPKHYLQKQPAYLALIDMVRQMGVTIPVTFTTTDWPVYPIHLLNKFVQMNIVEQMLQDKELNEKQKALIDSIILDERSKKEIQREIDEYMKRTTGRPASKIEEPEATTEPHETERTVKDKEVVDPRVEQIRKMMEA